MTALKKGFTLIELLIVIAILGVLAVVILVAINPLEQLARTRDAGRISSTTQIGHALQAFATANAGEYVDVTLTDNCSASGSWLDCLVDAGEIGSAPTELNYAITGVLACAVNVVAGESSPTSPSGVDSDGDGNYEGYCMINDTSGNYAGGLVYARLESGSNNSKCAPGEDAFFVFDSCSARGGLVCVADGTEPAWAGAPACQTFVD